MTVEKISSRNLAMNIDHVISACYVAGCCSIAGKAAALAIVKSLKIICLDDDVRPVDTDLLVELLRNTASEHIGTTDRYEGKTLSYR